MKKKFIAIVCVFTVVMIILYSGANAAQGRWWRDDIHFDAIEIRNRETDLKIAILDTGLSEHLLREINISNQFNAWSGSQNVYDNHGHGTWVMSIILDMVDAQYMIIKVTDYLHRSTPAILARGINYAVSQNADIINISMETSIYSLELKRAIENALAHGCIVIASSGNMGKDRLSYPAAFPGVISVGSSDVGNNVSNFSNYGYGLDVIAPGEHIEGLNLQGRLYNDSGTSASSAIVTGLIALIKSNFTDLDNRMIPYLMQYSAKDIMYEGKDLYSGNGIIQTDRLFNNAQTIMDIDDFSQYENMQWYGLAYDFGKNHEYIDVSEDEIYQILSFEEGIKLIELFLEKKFEITTTLSYEDQGQMTRELFMYYLLEADSVFTENHIIQNDVFADFANISEYLHPHISYAFSKALIKGRDNQYFYPSEQIRYSEAYQILFNYFMYKEINRTEQINYDRIQIQPNYHELAYYLIKGYLASAQSETLDQNQRIRDFEILDWEVLEYEYEKFVFRTTYWVQPFNQELSQRQFTRYITAEFKRGYYHIIDISTLNPLDNR